MRFAQACELLQHPFLSTISSQAEEDIAFLIEEARRIKKANADDLDY